MRKSNTNVYVETITPEMAKMFLSTNDRNRNINEDHVNALARQMRSGDFHFTGSGISIGKSGRLLDGQHRLMAVVKSGKPQPFVIVRNLEDRAQDVIDTTAKPRSASDILSMRGVKNANVTAGAAAIISRLIPELVITPGLMRGRITQPEIDRVLSAYPEIHHGATQSTALRGHGKFLQPSLVAAYWTLITCAHDEQLATEFFKSIYVGVGLSEGDPALALRNRLIQDMASVHKLPPMMKHIFLAKTWNAFISGEQIRVVRFLSTEKQVLLREFDNAIRLNGGKK